MTPRALKIRREERELAAMREKQFADLRRMQEESYAMDIRNAKAQAEFDERQIMINSAMVMINALFVDSVIAAFGGLLAEPKK